MINWLVRIMSNRTKTGRILNKDELQEIKSLAGTMHLKEIASHFGLTTVAFRRIRKRQPEIDQIFKETSISDKIFTPEEIAEVEKLSKTTSMEHIAKYFNTSVYFMKKARNTQPELERAITDGINSRGDSFFAQKMKKTRLRREHIEQIDKKNSIGGSRKSDAISTDSLDKRAPPDISYEDAIKRFVRLRDIEKEKRMKEEAKHSRETGGLL